MFKCNNNSGDKMKIFLLIFILLINGCSNSHTLNINNIQSINYNNIILIEKDYEEIINKINTLEFKEKEINNTTSNNLKIVTNDKIYNFNISNDIIYYEENNKIYGADNSLNNILNDIENKYNDLSFFNISYNKCDINNNNTLIKIDNTNNCLIINTNEVLYNFRINSVMSINEEIIENSLLYQKDEIKNNEILIKLNVIGNPKTKISFDTKYNYTVTLLPTFNNELELNMSKTQKK